MKLQIAAFRLQIELQIESEINLQSASCNLQ